MARQRAAQGPGPGPLGAGQAAGPECSARCPGIMGGHQRLAAGCSPVATACAAGLGPLEDGACAHRAAAAGAQGCAGHGRKLCRLALRVPPPQRLAVVLLLCLLGPGRLCLHLGTLLVPSRQAAQQGQRPSLQSARARPAGRAPQGSLAGLACGRAGCAPRFAKTTRRQRHAPRQHSPAGGQPRRCQLPAPPPPPALPPSRRRPGAAGGQLGRHAEWLSWPPRNASPGRRRRSLPGIVGTPGGKRSNWGAGQRRGRGGRGGLAAQNVNAAPASPHSC